MRRDIATKWAEALRSGEYRQCKEVLQRGTGGFCCLGVLCDLHRQAKGGEWVGPQPHTVGGLIYQPAEGGEDYSMLPEAVRDWAGLRSHNPSANGELLTVMNDEGREFRDLADLIETRWEDL